MANKHIYKHKLACVLNFLRLRSEFGFWNSSNLAGRTKFEILLFYFKRFWNCNLDTICQKRKRKLTIWQWYDWPNHFHFVKVMCGSSVATHDSITLVGWANRFRCRAKHFLVTEKTICARDCSDQTFSSRGNPWRRNESATLNLNTGQFNVECNRKHDESLESRTWIDTGQIPLPLKPTQHLLNYFKRITFPTRKKTDAAADDGDDRGVRTWGGRPVTLLRGRLLLHGFFRLCGVVILSI